MQTVAWHYRSKGSQKGPVTLDELRALHRSGYLAADAEVAPEDTMEWQPVAICAALNDALAARRIDPSRVRRSLGGAALGSAAAAAAALLAVGCLPYLSLPLGIAAVALGTMALREVREEPDLFRGRRVAYLAMTVGVVAALLGTTILVIYAVIGPPERPEEQSSTPTPAEQPAPDTR